MMWIWYFNLNLNSLLGKRMELEMPTRRRITLAVDPAMVRFGDNTIKAALKTTRKSYRVEVQWFMLSVTPRS